MRAQLLRRASCVCCPRRCSSFRRAAATASSGEPDALGAGPRAVASLAPPLSPSASKGSAGRVAVLGGCTEYTGAPYFAAYAALRCGADLAWVFCTRGAGPVIKAYSPELIVHPVLATSEELAGASEEERGVRVAASSAAVCAMLPRLSALVVGCGLGRDAAVLDAARAVVVACLGAGTPLVLDGDALHLLVREPGLLAGRDVARVVLTPNLNEFRRLLGAAGMEQPDGTGGCWGDRGEAAAALSGFFGGAVVLQKGAADVVAAGGAVAAVCDEPGSPRRAGGQGDVLAGLAGVFAGWAAAAAPPGEPPDLATAALAACTVVRRASSRAFAARRRAMLAEDVIAELGGAMQELAPV